MILKMGIALFAVALLSQSISAKTYTVAKSGGDFTSIADAIDKMSPGDSTIIAAGTYTPSGRISITKNGTPSAKYFLGTTGSDRAILDFSAMATNDTAQGIYITGNYWYLRGLDITKAGDNGILIESVKDASGNYLVGQGCYNTIEWCSVYRCQDAGFQIKRNGGNNKIINCDAYFNYDDKTSGGNADGFAPKMGPGDNYFFGCRSWNNSDDGWDGYIKDDQCVKTPTTTCDYCICYFNGYKESGSSAGNGNGFKMGSASTKYTHTFILHHCVSAKNLAKGFDQNHNPGSMTMINCSAYSNGKNEYYISEANTGLTLTNCVALGGKNDLYTNAKTTNCNWAATTGDFENVTFSNLIGSRSANGSLSDATLSFMRPTASSSIAKSTQGWIQKGEVPKADPGMVSIQPRQDFRPAVKSGDFINNALQLDNVAKIDFTVQISGNISASVFDVAGKKVMDFGSHFVNAGNNVMPLDMRNLKSGMYICKFRFTGNNTLLADHVKLIKE